MPPKKPETTGEGDLFRARLEQIIDLKHELVQLAGEIDWDWIDREIAPLCSRPARVLYARYLYDRIWFFTCRSCVGITYQSTMGHRWDRSARRVEKLRARLQWRVGTVPIKPRGMHERTYQRILGMLAYHEAVRKQGAGYARKHRPDQHRTHLWRQCRNGCGAWWMAGPLIFTSALRRFALVGRRIGSRSRTRTRQPRHD